MRISDWSSDVCSSDLLADAGEQRLVVAAIAEGQIVLQRAGVDAAGNAGHGQERLDLRGEDQPALVLQVVERLDAEPVAAQHQAPPRRIPDRKTEPEIGSESGRERGDPYG